ncbi:hypothetical protein CYLTODRAFT_488753 [Cylindrobasidium torrendii FP15055 ss-10]|uniref:Uncharacterized protein n=1 Tax=Cylindrobasidium torrendii FP15055 ss-10 TaxID=1314674 RepID=A0A0D7BHP4_9AGAR|nr:hypothetical protein CYLTODRAFT_488753 [Cylindrobasidium torrendii FP15055 ss-10]
MAFIPSSYWYQTMRPDLHAEKPTQSSVQTKTKYEREVVQPMNQKLQFQLFVTAFLLTVAAPVALPLLFLRIKNMDTTVDASFQTIIPAVYAFTLAGAGIMAHARSVLLGYQDRVTTKPSVSAFLFSISTRGNNAIKRSYIESVATASNHLNTASIAGLGLGVASLLFQFYPVGMAGLVVIAAVTLAIDSVASKAKTGTLLNSNALSAVSHLRGAVNEKQVGNFAPAL